MVTDAVLTPEEVSAIIKVPVNTLKFWRVRGEGPVWFPVGKHPRYLESDVSAWCREERNANKREIDERTARMAAS